MKLKLKLVHGDETCAIAIEAALEQVNGRARKFAITDAQTVLREAKVFEKRLAILPLRDRAGASYAYKPAGPWAAAYRSPAASTEITFTFSGDGKVVYLTTIEAIEVYPKQGERVEIAIKAAAHARYLEARARDFGVIAAAA